MAVRRVKDDTEIKVGQWILGEAGPNLCGYPRQVTKIQKTQYHFTVVDGKDAKERYYLRKTLRYVCDTEAEANQVYEISQQCAAELQETRMAVLNKHRAAIMALND